MIYHSINFILLGILISFTGKNKLKSLLSGENVFDKIAGISIIIYSIITVTFMVEAISEPHGSTDLDWIVVFFVILGFFYFHMGCAILMGLHRLTLALSMGLFVVLIPLWVYIISYGFGFNINSFFSIMFLSLFIVPAIVFIYSLKIVDK